MTKPNWVRTVTRLRKLAAALREHGFMVQEPAELEVPPTLRGK